MSTTSTGSGFPEHGGLSALLVVEWFTSISDAEKATELWRVEYNEERPHSSLGR